MSFDIETLDMGLSTAVTAFEAEAARKREILASSARAARPDKDAAGRRSILATVSSLVRRPRSGAGRSTAPQDGWA